MSREALRGVHPLSLCQPSHPNDPWVAAAPRHLALVESFTLVTMRKLAKDTTLLARLRKLGSRGSSLRRPGHDRTLRDKDGSWWAIGDGATIPRSARSDAFPDEALRELARRPASLPARRS
jgi:hypothetical protein